DKLAVLRAYGAEVVVCPTTVAPDHPESYYSVSDRLAATIPGAWKPDQYANPNNPEENTRRRPRRRTGGGPGNPAAAATGRRPPPPLRGVSSPGGPAGPGG